MDKQPRRDEAVELIAELLRERLQATFDKFREDLPAILASLRVSGTPSAGHEFVDALLAWVGNESKRSEQATRYLLIWYAKTLGSKRAHESPECRVVADLLRRHLGSADLAAVDQAIDRG